MSEPTTGPSRYRVVYSERVRHALVELGATAKAKGLGNDFLNALKEIDRLLHVYPQFGQSLRDLQLKPAQLWIAVVPPLSVRYLLDEERRLVIISTPLTPLPGSGLEK